MEDDDEVPELISVNEQLRDQVNDDLSQGIISAEIEQRKVPITILTGKPKSCLLTEVTSAQARRLY